MPLYLKSPGRITTDVPGVEMLVSINSCIPSFFSACANNLPSGEIAAQTDCPAFVRGVILIVWKGKDNCRGGGLSRLMNPFVQRGRPVPISKNTATAVIPEKIVALGCSLIPVKICSAVCET